MGITVTGTDETTMTTREWEALDSTTAFHGNDLILLTDKDGCIEKVVFMRTPSMADLGAAATKYFPDMDSDDLMITLEGHYDPLFPALTRT
jgi:hypothetical protein